jgi:hypothetical protein
MRASDIPAFVGSWVLAPVLKTFHIDGETGSAALTAHQCHLREVNRIVALKLMLIKVGPARPAYIEILKLRNAVCPARRRWRNSDIEEQCRSDATLRPQLLR